MLRDLDDAARLFGSFGGSFIGVGMTAYSRIVPAYFLREYRIISFRKTRDLPVLRRKARIFCLEEESGPYPEERVVNSSTLLGLPSVRDYLSRLPAPRRFLLYQNYPELEAGPGDRNLLANPSRLRERAGERSFFQGMLLDLKLRRIPGLTAPFRTFCSLGYAHWAARLSGRFVVRLPEIRGGGGRGTFFICSDKDYNRLLQGLECGTWRGERLERVFLQRYVEGIPVSLAMCLTGHGLLVSGLQRQLIDLPYCRSLMENGIFCGHSWGESHWDAGSEEEAIGQARSIGDYLYNLGYRGILGIDFLISRKGEVYPLECNPRFTGAFPMLSQMHMAGGLVPMEAFHMLEFMGASYKTDIEFLNSSYKKSVRGSHIILFALDRPGPSRIRSLEAGLFEVDPVKKQVSFLGEASDYTDFENDRQFILVDGPPDTDGGERFFHEPLRRLCRILFPCPVAKGEGNLSAHAQFVTDWVYDKLMVAPAAT